MSKQVEHITTGQAMEILNCGRAYFYRKYIKQLTLYKEENGHRNYFDKKEVTELAQTHKKFSRSKPKAIKMIRHAAPANTD